ncbi:hypothetical protein JI664_10685 [Rhodobacter sp. NTK016B]|uniref:hypothetical protein n=1 Tax=Rhodobacter sp. NTK016B TaxID=2759676 RepID=UPI001A8FCCC8|nr:hypothetical protein [Rhodobacter sp. NTK016B]MBN8292432.1 hypothetical protein [Rhodobacter sp. NTK016B]
MPQIIGDRTMTRASDGASRLIAAIILAIILGGRQGRVAPIIHHKNKRADADPLFAAGRRLIGMRNG